MSKIASNRATTNFLHESIKLAFDSKLDRVRLDSVFGRLIVLGINREDNRFGKRRLSSQLVIFALGNPRSQRCGSAQGNIHQGSERVNRSGGVVNGASSGQPLRHFGVSDVVGGGWSSSNRISRGYAGHGAASDDEKQGGDDQYVFLHGMFLYGVFYGCREILPPWGQ